MKSPSSHSYGDGAFLESQPRLTDLIPKKYSTLALLFLSGLAVVAGLEGLYAWMPRLASMTHDGRIAAFDLDGEGSLAMWFSSATLALASMVSLIIYYVRRHRQDDYHARYRIWLWAAGVWFLMSIDEGASLHEGFKEMMTAVTGHRVLGDGSIWWIGAYLLVLGVVGIRIFLDMRQCRAAMAAMFGTGLAFASAVVTQIQWVMPQSGLRGVMLEEGCEMIGNLLLLLSLGLYARHVILDAGGQLPAKPVAKKTEKKEESKKAAAKAAADSTPESGSSRRSDLQPTAKQTSSAGRAAAREDDDDDYYEDEVDERDQRSRRPKHRVDEAEDLSDDRKLNKTDRKAMRRHKEQHRRGDI